VDYSYDRSSDFALLEAQFRLLRPNARNGSLPFSPSWPSSWSSLLTRDPTILFSLLCLTCLPASLTRPRPQFPPILFSKQVCKTQFSCRLTSHLIARWRVSLFASLFILLISLSLSFSLSLSQLSACHFFLVLTILLFCYHTDDMIE